MGDLKVPRSHISRRMVLLLAVACSVAVGNIYFPQAVSPLVATGLQVSPATAASVVTAAQLGYAAGIFLLVALGDAPAPPVDRHPARPHRHGTTGRRCRAHPAAPRQRERSRRTGGVACRVRPGPSPGVNPTTCQAPIHGRNPSQRSDDAEDCSRSELGLS